MTRRGLVEPGQQPEGWSVNLAAEHGRYPRRAQPLREREEVVIQIPAAARQ